METPKIAQTLGSNKDVWLFGFVESLPPRCIKVAFSQL